MKLLLPFILITLAAFQRCNDDIVHLQKDQFILAVNETFDAGDVELQLVDISDSRCPKDVNCVWAGNALTTLLLKGPSLQDTLQFCLGNCRQLGFQEEHSDTLLVNKRRYVLTLLKVNPYPGTGKEGQEKTALYRFRELL